MASRASAGLEERALLSSYSHTFPAIRGIQAGREFYVTMVPLKLIEELFVFNEVTLPPELRSQRVLNKARVPEIVRYMLNNPKDYTFSALTASIDSRVRFEPFKSFDSQDRIGLLSVPMEARFLINDGQHRKAAIAEAVRQTLALAQETIPVVLFIDAGLRRSQQMFADLNKYAVKPTRSLGVLYDHKDPLADLVRNLIVRVPLFVDRIEKERTTISFRSRNLFTLSAVYQATGDLLGKKKGQKITQTEEDVAAEYWKRLPDDIPEWKMVIEGKSSGAELRKNYVHSHGVVLHALGYLGNSLIREYPKSWAAKLERLQEIDWSKDNPVWEGRAMSGGRLSKAFVNVILTTNYLKTSVGLRLNPSEEKIEMGHVKGRAAEGTSR